MFNDDDKFDFHHLYGRSPANIMAWKLDGAHQPFSEA